MIYRCPTKGCTSWGTLSYLVCDVHGCALLPQPTNVMCPRCQDGIVKVRDEDYVCPSCRDYLQWRAKLSIDQAQAHSQQDEEMIVLAHQHDEHSPLDGLDTTGWSATPW